MTASWMSCRREHDANFLLKFVLRIITTILTIGSIASAASTSGEPLWINTFQSIFTGAWVLSFIWVFAWFGIMLKRERPIHPAFPISFDLAFCLWYIIGTTLGAFYIPGRGYQMRIVVLPTFVFTTLCAIFHCWTFIIGCIEEHRRRKAVKAGQPDPTRTPQLPRHDHAACVGCNSPVEPYCANCHAIHVASLQAYKATTTIEAGRFSDDSIIHEKNLAASGTISKDLK